MNLHQLKEVFKDLATRQVGMNGYSFDDLSQVNAGDSNDYPLLYLTPPDSTISKIETPQERYTLNFWVFDLHFQDDEKELSEKWSDCRDLGVQFLRQLRAEQLPEINIIEPITITRGHHLNNDALIGCKFEFEVDIFTDCNVGTFE